MMLFIVFFFCLGAGFLLRWWLLRSREEAFGKAEDAYRRVLEQGALGVDLTRMKAAEQKPSSLASLAARLSGWGLFRSQGSRDVLFWLDRELRLAGRPYGWSAPEAVAFLLSFWLACLVGLAFLSFAGIPTIFLVGGTLIAFGYPVMKLRNMKKARQEQARLELPSFINDLAMNLSAGVTTIDDALGRLVSSEDDVVRERVLVIEFGQAWNEYRHGGRDREEALRDAAERIGVSSVDNFVDALIQGLRTGAPIRQTLLSQSQQVQAIFREDMRAYIGKKESSFVISLIFMLAGIILLGGVPLFLEVFSTFSR